MNLFVLPLFSFFVLTYSEECITIRGFVWCGAKPGAEHDGKVVFVQLVDGTSGTLDEAYTSKQGRFIVKGCSQRTFTSMTPELLILHQCKHNEKRRLKLPLPPNSPKDFNISQAINLKFDNPDEELFAYPNQEPCDYERSRF